MSASFAFNQYVHLTTLGCIKVSGADTNKFLQGQLTVNAEDISQDKLSMGALCNPQGRCIALFWATRLNDEVLLILPHSTIEATIDHLTKYAVFFKTELKDATKEYAIHGTISQQQLEHSQQELNDCLAHFHVADSSCYLAICQPSQPAIDELDLVESEWFYQLAIAAIPWLESSTQSAFLPHNLNLPELKAVDFNKGCFTGQEVIARMQYKGKLKSHMQLLVSQQAIEITPLSKLVSEGRDVGEVICSSDDQKTGTAVLALVRDKYLENKNFRLNSENGPILELSTKN